jgi:predicted AlkP superfamily pyrophosphatase or phosphodiesterase
MGKLLVISFDAVGDHLFERLLAYPRFAGLARESAVTRDVRTVFLSNTYPVHASVVTGVVPGEHGLVSNTDAFPQHHPRWHFQARRIQARTIWDEAAERGLTTAAVLWPITGGARAVTYNVPEILALPGQNQLVENLLAGSKRLQLELFTRYHRMLKGIAQPELDHFVTACASAIMKEKRPDLMLVHFTAYDTLCHEGGETEAVIEKAFAALDENLGTLLDAAEAVGEETAVMLFSDHAQINVHTVVTPNDLLVVTGLLQKDRRDYRPGNAFFECAGGSAFLHGKDLASQTVHHIRDLVLRTEGFYRFLTESEMRECGHADLPFGFCAKRGYCYENYPKTIKSQHGYPPDYDQYSVFYLVRRNGGSNKQKRGGSLLDIAPLAREIIAEIKS